MRDSDRHSTRSRWGRALLIVGVSAFAALVGLSIVLPIGHVVFSSFWSSSLGQPGHFTWSNYQKVFSDSIGLRLVKDTVIYTIGAGAIAVALGGLLAWCVSSMDGRSAAILRFLPMTPLFLPGLLRDTAWIDLYGPRTGLANLALTDLFRVDGPVFDIHSLLGLIVVLGITLTPIAYLILLQPFLSRDPAHEEASRMSGASSLQTLRRITVPSLAPALLSAMLLTTVLAAHSFETPILIGGPGGINSFMLAVFLAMSGSIFPDLNLASAEVMIYVLATGALLLWYLRTVARERRFAVVGTRSHSRRATSRRWLVAMPVVGYFLVAFVQLISVSLVVSLLPFYTATEGLGALFSRFSLENYNQALLSDGGFMRPLLNSIVLAGVVSALATSVALGVTFVSVKTKLPGRRLVEMIAALPIAFPALVFSVALLMTFLTTPGLKLAYGTLLPLVLADAVAFLPFALRITAPAMVQIKDELVEASRTAGASQMRTIWAVVLPLMRVALINAVTLVFILSFRELGAIVMLVTPNLPLLPTHIFSEWQAGFVGPVAALNVISAVALAITLLVGFVAAGKEIRWRF